MSKAKRNNNDSSIASSDVGSGKSSDAKKKEELNANMNTFPSDLVDDIEKAKLNHEKQATATVGAEESATAKRLFLPLAPDSSSTQETFSDELFRERIAEQKQRRHFRIVMFICFFILLLLQHAALVVLVYFAVRNEFIEKIQVMLDIIIPATLGETYALFKMMVNFVFTSGDFDDRSSKAKPQAFKNNT